MMRLEPRRGQEPLHLTYCSNIHPGESWDATRSHLERYIPQIKARVSPADAFGIGLRLSAEAADALKQPDELQRFKAWLEAQGAYVFTINGFPYGRFHGARVKEGVYLPDWTSDERLRYSDTLAELLAELLSHASASGAASHLSGSISTVPGCFRALGNDRARALIAERLIRQALSLWRLSETKGVEICLALEPEPACLLETTAEAVAFFNASLYSNDALAQFSKLSGLSASSAEQALRKHLGVCLDACHAAVEFEDPTASLRALRAAGIPLGKLQVTTGLSLESAGADQLAELRRYADEVYLHQVVVQQGDHLVRYDDLPQALERAPNPDESWRVHFHVPVFQADLGVFTNTQHHLRELLAAHQQNPLTTHLEVETYTFDVLPPELRTEDVARAISRELEWTREQLQ